MCSSDLLKWIAFAGLAAAIGFIVLAFLPGPEPVLAFIALVPLIAIAAGIAILKYRLYDIDLIISRTIVYLVVTTVLAGAFAGASSAAQFVAGQLTGHSSDAVSIVIAIAVAVAFTPLKTYVQRLVDRRLRTA